MLDNLDARAVERVSGRKWDSIRPKLDHTHAALMSAAPAVSSVLTTIYVKYSTPQTGGRPFAVVWLKKSSELVLGLSLPPETEVECAVEIPKLKYSGLTTYLRFEADGEIPSQLCEWAKLAHQHIAGG